MENESSAGAGPEIEITKTSNKSAAGFVKRNPVLFTALIGLLAVAVVYFWKDIQGKKQKAAIEKMAQEQLIEKSEAMLKIAAKPFVWSIRAEMLRDNMEQVNTYTKEMVMEKNFQLIQLIDPTGKIIVSTDKKLEGQLATNLYESSLLQTDSIIVVRKDDMLTVAAPVMGYDKRLGVLIMNYLPEKFNAEKNTKVDTTVLAK